jgi:catalase
MRSSTGSTTISRSVPQSKRTVRSLKVAVLLADGFDAAALEAVRERIEGEGARTVVVSRFRGALTAADGSEVEVEKPFSTTASVEYDALFIPGGRASVDALLEQGDAVQFVEEMFGHAKTIGATGEAVDVLAASRLAGTELASGDEVIDRQGVVTTRNAESSLRHRVKDAVGMGPDVGIGAFSDHYLEAFARHRHWDRAMRDRVPA